MQHRRQVAADGEGPRVSQGEATQALQSLARRARQVAAISAIAGGALYAVVMTFLLEGDDTSFWQRVGTGLASTLIWAVGAWLLAGWEWRRSGLSSLLACDVRSGTVVGVRGDVVTVLPDGGEPLAWRVAARDATRLEGHRPWLSTPAATHQHVYAVVPGAGGEPVVVRPLGVARAKQAGWGGWPVQPIES